MPAGLRAWLVGAAVAASAWGQLRPQAPDAAPAAFARGLQLFREAAEYKQNSPSEHGEAARRYRAAAQSFVEAWKAGAATTEVFTNAANAYYFAGAIGEAVLFYKRALSIDPANRRAADALDHLRERLPIKKPPAGAGASIMSALFFWHDAIAFRARKALFLALFPMAFLCFAVALLRRRPFLLIGICALVPALLLLGSILVSAWADSSRKEAVLLVEIEGRRGNGVMYSPSHSRPFPPGTEVAIEGGPRPGEGASGGGESWVRVRLLDGMESWVPARTVEKVLP